jgi:uncharacterized protein
MQASISQYVLKVHSRCDLACDYCYVYEHADQSWQRKPRAISVETATAAALRIAEHAAAHDLAEVIIILHGGEPLLVGRESMRTILAALTGAVRSVAKPELRIHTNGVLLDQQWCELLSEFGVRVGISLDGNRAANDLHRRYADGRSSHSQVLRALALLRRPEYAHLYAGILCTVDLSNDPVAVYEALIAEAPPRLDLLLPHATWENPPHRPAGREHPYADWLLRLYHRWVTDGCRIPIRLFDSLLSSLRGGPSWTESIGLDPVDLLVVDTDGSWEQPDSMKTAFDGAPATGLEVFSHSIDEAVRHPQVAARQQGAAALCVTCRACPVVRVCGGGLYAHRYRAGSDFDNPSVYCPDLIALIDGVAAERKQTLVASSRRATHHLSAGAFEALAAGPGDVRAIEELAQMRLSMTRALVATVADHNAKPDDSGLRDAAAEGWALLCALDAERPGAVQDVLSHPYAQAWAMRCLRPPRDADIDLDRAHLAGLAAAAAIRAGVSAELPLPIRDGKLHMPTVGAIAVPTWRTRSAVVLIRPDAVPTAREGGVWEETRYLHGELGHVAVEDLDPFRDCQEWPVTGRLSPQSWKIWQQSLDSATGRLTDLAPRYARALQSGLRAIVPLRRGTAMERGSTAYQAFGAVAVSAARKPEGVAALLLHEFQHVKLNALTDFHQLVDRAYTPLFRVPWRDDPRPADAALHGAYAYLSLVHLHQSEHAGSRNRNVQYSDWVGKVTGDLLDAGALTRTGQQFVQGIQTALDTHPS